MYTLMVTWRYIRIFVSKVQFDLLEECSQERGSKGCRIEYIRKREEKQNKNVTSVLGELQSDPKEMLWRTKHITK